MRLPSKRAVQLSCSWRSTPIRITSLKTLSIRPYAAEASGSTQFEHKGFSHREQYEHYSRADNRLQKAASVPIKQSSKDPVVISTEVADATSGRSSAAAAAQRQERLKEQRRATRKQVKAAMRKRVEGVKSEVRPDPARTKQKSEKGHKQSDTGKEDVGAVARAQGNQSTSKVIAGTRTEKRVKRKVAAAAKIQRDDIRAESIVTSTKTKSHKVSEQRYRESASQVKREEAVVEGTTALPVGDDFVEEALQREAQAVEQSNDLASDEIPDVPRMREKNPRIVIADGILAANEIVVHEIPPLRDAPVATLGRGLQRVLFNPSIHYLSDPRTSVFNFEETMAHIPAVDEFAYDRCPQYVTASRDPELLEMSEHYGAKYFGSTSTLTKALSQIYFAISGGKPVSYPNLSLEFAAGRTDYTAGAKIPACLTVKQLPGGKYAVDNDKHLDIDENVLSDMGRVLEKMLTTEDADFRRFLKTSPESAVSSEERNAREAYRYSKISNMLMRSQLDCHDPRLPGTGTFDIKTRACLPIRHDRANYLGNSEYDISKTHGFDQSFEREYYDLIRSGMLKYSLQARIGNMDGIFVAYHNTRRLFGFQYLPLEELDARLFGSTEMGDAAYKLSVSVFEAILEQAAQTFPETSFSLTIDNSSFGADRRVTAWATPEIWDKTVSAEQPTTSFVVKFDMEIDGQPVMGHVNYPDTAAERALTNWTIKYEISKNAPTAEGEREAKNRLKAVLLRVIKMQKLTVPEGKTVEEMTKRDELLRRSETAEADGAGSILNDAEGDAAARQAEPAFAAVNWVKVDGRVRTLRSTAAQSGREYREREERIVRERGFARPPLPAAHYTSQQAVDAARRRASSR